MEKVNINGVAETMIQTLYARAKESKKANHKIYDPLALEVVERLDYDFSQADKDLAMSSGVIARTLMLDQMVQDYLKNYPHSVIINMGCGMDTRFYRVDNGMINWFNIDLTKVIEVRNLFLQENERVTNIASSILDEKWVNMITSKADNYLIIIEGLTMYLTKDDIKTLLGIISTHFHHVTIFMETMNPFVVKRIKEKSIEKTHSKFTWGIKTGKELEKYNSSFTFIKDDYLTTGMKQIYPIYHFIEKIKFIRNISNKITILQSHEERKEK